MLQIFRCTFGTGINAQNENYIGDFSDVININILEFGLQTM